MVKPPDGLTWREWMDTWPEIRLTVLPLPWTWRFHYYRDDIHRATVFATFLCLQIEVLA